MNGIIVVEYEKKYQRDFESLNRTWIEKYFRIEPADEYVLQHPEENIIQKGGAILIALHNSLAIGVVGLRKTGPTAFELIKMAVAEDYRGKGVGELLGYAALEKARELGAEKIWLYSHSSLQPALALYRKLGFVEVHLDPALEYEYERADVKMEILVTNISIRQHPFKMFL